MPMARSSNAASRKYERAHMSPAQNNKLHDLVERLDRANDLLLELADVGMNLDDLENTELNEKISEMFGHYSLEIENTILAAANFLEELRLKETAA